MPLLQNVECAGDSQRRADQRLATVIHAALGGARTVINVGARAASYEPADRVVLAVEPSRTMRAQRPSHLVPAIDATAEALPSTMACLTRQWHQ